MPSHWAGEPPVVFSRLGWMPFNPEPETTKELDAYMIQSDMWLGIEGLNHRIRLRAMIDGVPFTDFKQIGENK